MKSVSLGMMAEFVNGVAFKPEDWCDSGSPIIRIQNLSDSSRPYNYTNRLVDQKYVVNQGDLLVSWSATLGVFEWNGLNGALLNQHIFKVYPKTDMVNSLYLKYGLTIALSKMQAHLHGATMQHVNRGEFLKTEIPLPPLPEQQRIAALLDEADRQRTLARQQLAEFDKLAEAVFVEMFGDPVLNEMGWDRKPLGTLAQIKLGKMLDASKQTHLEQFSYLGNANVQWGRFELANLKTMGFAEKDRLTFQLLPGDLLMCEGGEVGRCAIWKGEVENCFYQKAIHRIRTNAQILSAQFLQSQMQLLARLGGLKDYVTVATIAHLTAEKLTQLPIILPPISLQEKYANAIASIVEEHCNASLIYDNAETLFQSLMHQSFGAQ